MGKIVFFPLLTGMGHMNIGIYKYEFCLYKIDKLIYINS